MILQWKDLEIRIRGDGTSTQFIIDLSKPPMDINISGANKPTGVDLWTEPITSATIDSPKLTLNFSTPPIGDLLLTLRLLWK
jgi:hypothetical protein